MQTQRIHPSCDGISQSLKTSSKISLYLECRASPCGDELVLTSVTRRHPVTNFILFELTSQGGVWTECRNGDPDPERYDLLIRIC